MQGIIVMLTLEPVLLPVFPVWKTGWSQFECQSLVPWPVPASSSNMWGHSHFVRNIYPTVVTVLATEVNWDFKLYCFFKLRTKWCMFEKQTKSITGDWKVGFTQMFSFLWVSSSLGHSKGVVGSWNLAFGLLNWQHTPALTGKPRQRNILYLPGPLCPYKKGDLQVIKTEF